MVRKHKYMEPRFTLIDACSIAGNDVDYMLVSQWIGRQVIKAGEVPAGKRRTYYSVADAVTFAVISRLTSILTLGPTAAATFIDKAQMRLAQISRGDRGLGVNYLMGWQSDEDTWSVKPITKMAGVDWDDIVHPVVILPIDAIINYALEQAGEKE